MAQKDIQPYSFEPIPRKKTTNDQDDLSNSSSSDVDDDAIKADVYVFLKCVKPRVASNQCNVNHHEMKLLM